MTRDEAYQLLTRHLHNKNLIKHSLAAEAAMKAIYRHLTPEDKQDAEEEVWGITGLLHDIDYEIAQQENKLDQHGTLIFDREPNVIPENIAHAVKAHNFENTKVMPESPMDWGITCADQLTGLIVACGLVHPARNASASVAGGPERKLAPLSPEFILKRMKEKSFAKGVIREYILLCHEKLGIPLPEFVAIVLKSMQQISGKLGL